MTERNGVRIGQGVRDLDGTRLGRVKKLHDWGFAVARGFLLFRRDAVLRYGEVRGVRDGELVVARSSRDLLDLAEGRLPPAWRIPAPPEFPSAATPDEARLVLEDIAAGAITSEGRGEAPARPPAPPPGSAGGAGPETRGQAALDAPPSLHS